MYHRSSFLDWYTHFETPIAPMWKLMKSLSNMKSVLFDNVINYRSTPTVSIYSITFFSQNQEETLAAVRFARDKQKLWNKNHIGCSRKPINLLLLNIYRCYYVLATMSIYSIIVSTPIQARISGAILLNKYSHCETQNLPLWTLTSVISNFRLFFLNF